MIWTFLQSSSFIPLMASEDMLFLFFFVLFFFVFFVCFFRFFIKFSSLDKIDIFVRGLFKENFCKTFVKISAVRYLHFSYYKSMATVKQTAKVKPKELVSTISYELVVRFQPDLHGYITIGNDEELIRIWWPWPFLKVTAGLKLPNLIQKVLVCTISHEPAGGF